MIYPCYLLLIQRRLAVQLANADPIVGTVFGALIVSVAILITLGGVR